jgi:integrase
MTNHNPENERIKRAYFTHLKAAKGLSEASIDAVAKAIHRFETSTEFRRFKKFHIEQAIAFRRRLDDATNIRTEKPLSKATMLQTLNALRAFFLWLAEQAGYRSRISYSDAEYFRLSEKDARIAKAPRSRPVPTPEQIENLLTRMPSETDIQMRNRALIAFTWLTGVRDGALASLKVRHLDLDTKRVNQDPREVKTKNSKAIATTFFPVGGSAQSIVEEWIRFLRSERLWGLDDPLFPATLVTQDNDRRFKPNGLARKHWSNAGPIRGIFLESFEAAGLPGFNPHSFRHALAMLGERLCRTPEEFKAWSQNLGHEQVLTTFASYGEVAPHRQAALIRGLGIQPNEKGALADIASSCLRLLDRNKSSDGTIDGICDNSHHKLLILQKVRRAIRRLVGRPAAPPIFWRGSSASGCRRGSASNS